MVVCRSLRGSRNSEAVSVFQTENTCIERGYREGIKEAIEHSRDISGNMKSFDPISELRCSC